MFKKLGIILLVFLVITVLSVFGFNASEATSSLLTWGTLFILPWIALYWIVRLVKAVESKK